MENLVDHDFFITPNMQMFEKYCYSQVFSEALKQLKREICDLEKFTAHPVSDQQQENANRRNGVPISKSLRELSKLVGEDEAERNIKR